MFIHRRIPAILATIALLCVISPPVFSNERKREVAVMTYNMYPGTEFSEIFAAGSAAELMSEVGEAYTDVVYSDPRARISAIGKEIARSSPTLVALQEAALWKTGTFLDPGDATEVSYDFLQLLLEELNSRGRRYAVISLQENFSAELPAVFADRPPADVRYVDRVAIIARTDLGVSDFRLEAVNSGNFVTELPFPHPVIGTVFIKRGWNSADVKLRGKAYRFVNAHLESFSELVQYLQAFELLQGPAATDLPVILAGDLNSDAEANGASYNLLLSGGLIDTWDVVNPADPGHTWPLFLADPHTPTSPNQRLDVIFVRGGVTPISASRVGLASHVPGALIPSDHTGVIAHLSLHP
jgi:hypothetical protein